MLIKTIIERDDKSFEFTAVLNPDQHAYLINFAVSTLMARGVIPFDTTPLDVGDIPKEQVN